MSYFIDILSKLNIYKQEINELIQKINNNNEIIQIIF